MARPKQITDEELLEIALECFLEHGHDVSAQIIADKAGLSQPALFKRFGTKEELFIRAIAPPEHLPVFDWLDANPSPQPFQPQLVEMIEKVWETLSWVLPRVQLIQAARLPRGTVMSRYETPPPVKFITSMSGFFERAQQQGQIRKGVNPQLLAQLVFGALMGRSFLSQTIPLKRKWRDGMDSTASIESIAEMLCRGILDDEDKK